MLLHTADVLIIELRCCRRCGASFEVPSPVVHQLYHSVKDEPRKIALTPRPPGDGAHSSRAVRVVSVPVEACSTCFGATIPYEVAEHIVPDKPVPVAPAKPLKPATPIPSIEELI